MIETEAMTVVILVCLMICSSAVAANQHDVEKRGIFDFASRFFKSEICYKRVGCFSNSGSFSDMFRRPINMLPEDPQTMNMEFNLVTRASDKKQGLFLDDADSVSSSAFNASNKVKFIVHGYMDNSEFQWVTRMTEELLLNDDYNVIVVDWSRGAMPPYAQAVANARVVGAMMAEMINFLSNHTGISPSDCHIIGHSLGAHIAGYCGEKLDKIDRITGLDPAYPYFKDMPSEVVLDPSDASFVDVIHTDGQSILLTGMGINNQLGHMDFYPNGGHDQPGCTASNKVTTFFSAGIVGGVRTFFACSHLRAMDYFTESINSDCPFTGFKCASWQKFKEGECNDCTSTDCIPMGFHADKHRHAVTSLNKKFFLKTNEESPFCYYNYWLRLNLEKKTKTTDVNAIIYLTLHGSNGDLRDAKLFERDIKLEHSGSNRSYTLLLPSMLDLGRVSTGSLSWNKSSFLPGMDFLRNILFKSREKLFIRSIEIHKLDSLNRDESNVTYSKICNRDEDPVGSDEVAILSSDKCPDYISRSAQG